MLRKLLGTDKGFALAADSYGIALVLDFAELRDAKRGNGGDRVMVQLATLRILEEQGLAEEIGNGFHIPSEAAVQLDKDVRDQLGLPDAWQGFFRLNATGATFSDNFSFILSIHRPNGDDAGYYDLQGPLIRLSHAETYLPSLPQWEALAAAELHRTKLSRGQGSSEIENLKAIHTIQKATRDGANIDLGPFKCVNISEPERVGIAVVATNDGGLELIPNLEGSIDPDQTRARLGQISNRTEGSIRIGDRIVILDKGRMRAVREVVENRKVSSEQREAFLQNPAAFIDASLVDLDLGFSIRVKGAARFRLAYFGETEGSEIDWFGELGSETRAFSGLAGARQIIKDLDDLKRFEELLQAAMETNAKEFVWSPEAVFQFDDPEDVRQELDKIRFGLEQGGSSGTESIAGGEGPRSDDDNDLDEQDTGPTVVEIDKHDEDGAAIEKAPESWLEVIEKSPVDLSNLLLQPYSYQEQGIRWILGLARKSMEADADEALLGSLLADDMGLGKTFMTLAAIEQYYVLCERSSDTARPVLVVAPLSLLETWRDEVAKVFKTSPFHDVVVLQSDGDLGKFRRPGGGRETVQSSEALEAGGRESLAKIRYSLYVGDDAPIKRLDVPRRLVLTSYQTLRDYQFSLSRVDWSFVVFDEAQNIKNPNALQTRAAKALKARFRLVVTGTPVENELRDFWCLFDTARPAVIGSYQDFRRTYVKPIIVADPESRPAVRETVGKKLRQQVGGFMLRRLKEDHLDGLPTKTIMVGVDTEAAGEVYSPSLAAEMPPEQLERYDSVISGVQAALASDTAQGAALTGLHHLRAVSLHPDCLAGGMPRASGSAREIEKEFRRSGKLARVLEILDEVRGREEKVIIFCINKRLQAFLQIGLSNLFRIPMHVINGDTAAVAKKGTDATRKSLIAEFEGRPGFGVIIMSPVAAGVGLTVVGANNVIHLERHWNPAKESQATDRVYRIGQQRPVNVYVPVLHHPSLESFDVNLSRLLAKKAGLRDAIITPDAVTPEEMVGSGIFGTGVSQTASRVTIERLDTVGWEYFEALVAVLVRKEHSATVHLTDLHDKGCDIVVLPSAGPGRLIQCKHTASQRLKGYSPITEVVGAKPIYEDLAGRRFEYLEVFTNARSYDKEARSTAKASGVILNEWKDLRRLIRRHEVLDSDVLAMLSSPRMSSKNYDSL